MSWWRRAGDYGVYFNRDEQKTRSRADPPFLWSSGFLAPKDPEGSGTWLSVNPAGLILALLNRWHEGANGTRSRGLLIPELAMTARACDVDEALRSRSLTEYSPFTLVAMDASEIVRWDWTGVELRTTPAEAPITSSSFRFQDVRARREQAYRDLGANPPPSDELSSYHQQSRDGAFATRMLRDDAQTWSRSQIMISSAEICWDYFEEFSNFQQPARCWQSRLVPTPARE